VLAALEVAAVLLEITVGLAAMVELVAAVAVVVLALLLPIVQAVVAVMAQYLFGLGNVGLG
jgi:hypothetical protein